MGICNTSSTAAEQCRRQRRAQCAAPEVGFKASALLDIDLRTNRSSHAGPPGDEFSAAAGLFHGTWLASLLRQSCGFLMSCAVASCDDPLSFADRCRMFKLVALFVLTCDVPFSDPARVRARRRGPAELRTGGQCPGAPALRCPRAVMARGRAHPVRALFGRRCQQRRDLRQRSLCCSIGRILPSVQTPHSCCTSGSLSRGSVAPRFIPGSCRDAG